MKKKLLGMFLAVMSLFFLAACGQEKLDGEYYEYFIASNTGELTMSIDEPDVTINGNSITLDNTDFTIDKDKKIIQTRFDTYHYTFEDDVLSFNGETYAKKDSKKYKEVLEKISKQK